MMRAGGYYHYAIIFTLMYRPCPDCLSFLLQTFPSADSTFRDRQPFFDSQLKVKSIEHDCNWHCSNLLRKTTVLLAIYSEL